MNASSIEILPPEQALTTLAPVVLTVEPGLDSESANSLKAHFESMFTKADEWRKKAAQIKVTDPRQTREMKLARETRLALKEIRVDAEKTRKQLKEESLRKGKAIDGIANTLKFLIEPIEDYLSDQENFALRLEQKRKEERAVIRTELLTPYVTDTAGFNLLEMTDANFDSLLSNFKLAEQAKIEAERKAEADRLAKEAAEAAERERIRQENARLKAEAEAAEARLMAERKAAEEAAKIERDRVAAEAKAAREKAEAEAKAAAEIARKEREAIEAKAKAEREAAAAAALKERQAREKAEAELKAKQEEETKAKAAQAAAARKAARAPDKQKILAFAAAIRAVEFPKPSSEESTDTFRNLEMRREAFANVIEQCAESL